MKANLLKCKNFRNLAEQSVELYEGMNVICGENAQGKTNFAEALWLFTGAKSFRFSKDEQMIAIGADSAKLYLEYEKNGLKQESEIIFAQKKQVTQNGKKLRSAASLAGMFLAIIFSPADLNLVWGDPMGRRRFIDSAICMLYPRYVDILKNYTRAVIQRNSVLKNTLTLASCDSMLDAFDSEITVLGEKLITYRRRYIELLNEVLPSIFEGLSKGKEKIRVEYAATCENGIENALKLSRETDFKRKFTGVGPHRDDIKFYINDKEVKIYGSQGQRRSVCLCLKLAEAQIIKNTCGEQPVAILDDVMSELDPGRQEFVLNHIKDWQVFITCCDPQNIALLETGKIFNMKNGLLTPQN